MKTILIVEDVPLNCELLVQLLEKRYELVLAEDGATALRCAAEDNPDLILMDLSLPREGWEATRRLKADQSLARIPIIVLTKPIDENVLFENLARHLGS
jgi:CheY-like chemotaxis protein